MSEVEAGRIRAGAYVRIRGWAIRRLVPQRSSSGNGTHSWRTAQLPPAADSDSDSDLQVGHGWSAGAHWATTAVRTGVWIAVACGPVALVGVLTGGSSTPTVVQAAGADATAGERASVGEFAERFVTTWVETDGDHVGRLQRYVEIPDTLSWPSKAVGNAAAAEVSRIDRDSTGLWSVTVGTDVTPSGGDPKRRYYRVAISYQGGALMAAGLPTPVASPPTADPPETAYPYELSLDSSAGKTISAFLNAMLTGRGDISRYVSPGSGIRAISSAPYDKVQIQYVGSDLDLGAQQDRPEDGDQADVLVTATALRDGGAGAPVQYALNLRSRDGRWEVGSIRSAPQITDDATSGSSIQEETP